MYISQLNKLPASAHTRPREEAHDLVNETSLVHLPHGECFLSPRIPKLLTTLLSWFLRRYGDRLPLSFVARIIGVVWFVAGVILTGILVSAISVSLTGETVGLDYKLYGAKVICWNCACIWWQEVEKCPLTSCSFLLTLPCEPHMLALVWDNYQASW